MMNNLTDNDYLKVDSIFVGRIKSTKYVCQIIKSGKYQILENGDVVSSSKTKTNSRRITDIKPCRYYQELLPDEITRKELSLLQDKLNSLNYVEEHSIDNLYLRSIAGICRYVDVASSRGLFKRVKCNDQIVGVPVNHNYDVNIYSAEEELSFLDIVRRENMKPKMTIDEINEEIRAYEISTRIEIEEEREHKQEHKKKSLLKSLFRK